MSEELETEASDGENEPEVSIEIEQPERPPSARDEIYDLYRQAQHAERQEEPEAVQFEEELPEELQEAQVDESEPVDVDPLVDVLVDGVVTQLPQSEVIAQAQMNMAADNRLEKAKALLAKMQEHEVHMQEATTPSEAPAEEPVATLPDVVTDEELDAIVDGIQIGDSDEGKAGLRKLVDKIVNEVRQNQQPQQDVQAIVTDALFQSRQTEQLQGAINRFAQQNEDIAKDPTAVDLVTRASMQEMRNDLLSLGYTPDQVNAAGDNMAILAKAHHFHHTAGRLRGYDEVLNSANQYVRQIYAPLAHKQTSEPSEEVAKREAMKSQIQQPKLGTNRSAPPGRPKPPTPEEIVAKMRSQRNYPTS